MNRLMKWLWQQSHKEINDIYKMFDKYGYRLANDGKIYLTEQGEIEIEFQDVRTLKSTKPDDVLVPASWEFSKIHDHISETIDLSIQFDMDILKMEVIRLLHGFEVIARDGIHAITSHPCPECEQIVVEFVGHDPRCKLCQVNEIMSS